MIIFEKEKEMEAWRWGQKVNIWGAVSTLLVLADGAQSFGMAVHCSCCLPTPLDDPLPPTCSPVTLANLFPAVRKVAPVPLAQIVEALTVLLGQICADFDGRPTHWRRLGRRL